MALHAPWSKRTSGIPHLGPGTHRGKRVRPEQEGIKTDMGDRIKGWLPFLSLGES